MTNQEINYYRIEKAIGYLTENFKGQPSLEEIADKVNMSPFHFQRIFTDWVGISPKKFIQHLTLDYLRNKISETENMIDAADLAGLSSQSRVHDLFISIEGVSPQQYKTSGKGLEIFYGYHASPFGLCFIAVSEKGICTLKFIDEEKSRNEFELFSQQWQFASLIHRPDYTQEYLRKIFQPDKTNPEKLNLLTQGTDFQIKVWEALLKIPFGAVSSFQQIAQIIEQPNATRSVASAIGKNSILYLIPCHRIISKNGTMGNYHYGKVRKQTMIGWEMSKTQP
ncbi:bifunctional helix-turn-helix domain-containing protein/methylated-DNA--[protein]-cysteine S-methyltransferase [Pedobacter borealis]|uniref:bifunctional helix-turn-helix domain-containing protein/methylated-DNA--[protein]-cysteine S-methyltransferase n=1 Tax=Pedobacter borealis TaxID=475254 RepID=UPI0004936373|nr:methylated-DNA--[protein]-cysteine S-methyltransferase [Pedobacter borealis]